MLDIGFNLLDEPWLLARRDGRVVQLSLLGLFSQAHQLDGLAGDLPTQEAALHRLLAAILYRALRVEGSLERRIDAWAQWWEADTMPVDRVHGYLEGYRDRFDLLCPTQPFMQVAGMEAGKTSGLTKLLADVPDGSQFFTVRAAGALESVDLAEAARWLVHTQAYDPSGIKSGVHGDPRVKGGKGYPIGIGWAGWCGTLIPQGATVKDTLLLSLVLSAPSAGEGWERDRPVWERPPIGPAPEQGHEEPTGTADLLTWQSRRVRLLTDGDRVVDALIGNGDPIHPRNRQALEPYTGWRYSEPQSKKYGGVVYMPRAHDPERALWRGLEGLLPLSRPANDPKSGAPRSQAPELLKWLSELVIDRALDPAYPVHLQAVGVVYGVQSATIGTVIEDRLRLRAAVLSDPALSAAVLAQVQACEAGVLALRNLAGNLAAAAGESEVDGHRDRAGEAGYAALDEPFRRWLDGLTPDIDVTAAEVAWQAEVNRLLRRLGDDLVQAAGRPAWLGRHVARSGRYVDASLSMVWFRSALRKALPTLGAASLDRATAPTDPHDEETKEEAS